MEFDILCVFTPTGKTFTFENVKILHDNETVLQFSCAATSDEKIKLVTFSKAMLFGWSVTQKS